MLLVRLTLYAASLLCLVTVAPAQAAELFCQAGSDTTTAISGHVNARDVYESDQTGAPLACSFCAFQIGSIGVRETYFSWGDSSCPSRSTKVWSGTMRVVRNPGLASLPAMTLVGALGLTGGLIGGLIGGMVYARRRRRVLAQQISGGWSGVPARDLRYLFGRD